MDGASTSHLNLLLGQKNSPFARRFVGDQLKRKCTVLNDDSFEVLKPMFSKATTIFIENQGTPAGKCHDKLLKTIKEKDTTIVMKDCAPGDLLGYATVSPRGKYVAVKNRLNGRRQHIFVGDTQDDLDRFLKTELKDDSKPEESKKDEKKKDEITHTLDQFITLQLINYSHTDKAETWLADSTVKVFVTLDIFIYTALIPETKANFKWIKFTLNDASGITTTMGNDRNAARGYFNKSVDIKIHPASKVLPVGWSRPHLAPQSSNSESEYTTKTGWGAEVSTKGEVVVKYDSSQEEKRTIRDFSVRNSSDGVTTSWYFYYTALEGEEKYWNHFT